MSDEKFGISAAPEETWRVEQESSDKKSDLFSRAAEILANRKNPDKKIKWNLGSNIRDLWENVKTKRRQKQEKQKKRLSEASYIIARDKHLRQKNIEDGIPDLPRDLTKAERQRILVDVRETNWHYGEFLEQRQNIAERKKYLQELKQRIEYRLLQLELAKEPLLTKHREMLWDSKYEKEYSWFVARRDLVYRQILLVDIWRNWEKEKGKLRLEGQADTQFMLDLIKKYLGIIAMFSREVEWSVGELLKTQKPKLLNEEHQIIVQKVDRFKKVLQKQKKEIEEKLLFSPSKLPTI